MPPKTTITSLPASILDELIRRQTASSKCPRPSLNAPPSIASVLSTAIPDDIQDILACDNPEDAYLLLAKILDDIYTQESWILDLPPDVLEYLFGAGVGHVQSGTPLPADTSLTSFQATAGESTAGDSRVSNSQGLPEKTGTAAADEGSSGPSGGLSGAQIAGAVVGGVLAFVGLAVGAFMFWKRRKSGAKARDDDDASVTSGNSAIPLAPMPNRTKVKLVIMSPAGPEEETTEAP